MATPLDAHEDTSSLADSYWTSSSSSTVPGPGAITGKFIKALGESTLDVVVSVIIRGRLRAIKRILERDPLFFRDPAGEAERQKVDTMFADLKELCSELGRSYYSASTRETATKLIQTITLTTRGDPDLGINTSPSNARWEKLLDQVHPRRPIGNLANPAANYKTGSTQHDHNSYGGDLTGGISRSPYPTVLIVGAKKVGKSTISDQFRKNDPNRAIQDVNGFHDTIPLGVIAAMQIVLLDLYIRDIEYVKAGYPNTSRYSLEVLEQFGLILSLGLTPVNLSARKSVGVAISSLWNNRMLMMQEMLHHAKWEPTRHVAKHTYTYSSVSYFFASAHRIFSPDYVPTIEDTLRHRILFNAHWDLIALNDAPCLLMDNDDAIPRVWLQKFLALRYPLVIVFVVAVTDYNVYEEGNNAMHKSCEYFQSLAEMYPRSTIILLFNKVDALDGLLKTAPLKEHFPGFTGDDTLHDAREFFLHHFLDAVTGKNASVPARFVSASDKIEMRNIDALVCQTVLRLGPDSKNVNIFVGDPNAQYLSEATIEALEMSSPSFRQNLRAPEVTTYYP